MTDFNASASHISLMHRPFGPRVHMDESASGGAPAGGGGDAAGSMPESFSDVGAAFRHMVSQREKREQAAPKGSGAAGDDAGGENSPAEGANPATAETELSEEDNAAPDTDPATGETQETAPAEQPPRELPRSWTKDQAANWAKLDPATQDFLLEQDRKASAEIRRVQNEYADKLKGLTPKEQAAEQARQTYENQARQALNILLRDQQRDFPDIKTPADVVELSKTDPLRFIQWQAHQQELQVQHAAVKEADDRAAKEDAVKWNSFRSEQDRLAIEHIPDLGNAEKAPALMKKAVEHLQGLGFTAEELGKYDGGEKLSLFDHRVQRLIFDAMRYQDVQKAAKQAAAKPVPPVQRPGVKAAGNGGSERLQALNTKLNNSGSLTDAVALYQARKGAARR